MVQETGEPPRRGVKAMRRDIELVLYGAAFLVFAAVVLWAKDASWPLLAIFAGVMAALLALTVWPLRRPKVLVVGERTEPSRAPALGYALAGAGYDVCWCPGPAGRPCPVTLGRPCPLSERRPVAAVIPCGQALWVPALAVEEGSDRAPEIAGRYARIGGDRGPDAAVRALERMFGR